MSSIRQTTPLKRFDGMLDPRVIGPKRANSPIFALFGVRFQSLLSLSSSSMWITLRLH